MGFFAVPGFGPFFGQILLPDMDLVWNPQTLIDDFGAAAGDGDVLTASGKVFDNGQGWRSIGEYTDYLDCVASGNGDFSIHHSAGPNSLPVVRWTATTAPAEHLFPNRTAGTIPVATESHFHSDTFTGFTIFTRTSASNGAIAGTYNSSEPGGWVLQLLTGVVRFVWSDGLGGFGITSQAISTDTDYIIGFGYDGSTGYLWVNKLFGSPNDSDEHAFVANGALSSNSDKTFQLGDDGESVSACRGGDMAWFAMKNEFLGQAQHNAYTNYLSNLSGISVT